MRKNFYSEISESSIISGDKYQKFNATLTYTFKQGDGQRLNKEGILTVYNIDQPIEIPVTKLLGKWRENYIGIAVGIRGGEWAVEKQNGIIKMNSNNKSSEAKTHSPKAKSARGGYKPLNALKRIFNKRVNDENLLPNM